MEQQAFTELVAMLDYVSAKLADSSAYVNQLETGRVSNYITDMQAHENKITDAKSEQEAWKNYANRLKAIIEDRIKATTGL